ncbi:hypothetical protein C8R44DRAFT_884891 [Mycena epipterygia]|nr:hypothetical protein C8R44DRAFT_884891 [Mycena epipterygia]
MPTAITPPFRAAQIAVQAYVRVGKHGRNGQDDTEDAMPPTSNDRALPVEPAARLPSTFSPEHDDISEHDDDLHSLLLSIFATNVCDDDIDREIEASDMILPAQPVAVAVSAMEVVALEYFGPPEAQSILRAVADDDIDREIESHPAPRLTFPAQPDATAPPLPELTIAGAVMDTAVSSIPAPNTPVVGTAITLTLPTSAFIPPVQTDTGRPKCHKRK